MKTLSKLLCAVPCFVLLLAGCTPDLIKGCCVGESYDEALFAEEFGCAVPDETILEKVKYSYKEYPFTYKGVECVIQVSNEGVIIGTLIAFPCDEKDPSEKISKIKDRMMNVYADKLEACGAKEGKVVISIKHELDAKKIVATCQDVDFSAKIEKNNEMAGCVVRRRRVPRGP